MYSRTFISIYLSLFLIQTGCATSRPELSALSNEVQTSFGTIGTVTGRFAPKVAFQKPEPVQTTGDSAAAGRTAGRVLGQMWKACAEAMVVTAPFIIGPIVVAYGCIVATPFVAIGGAAYGSTRESAKANRYAKNARKAEVKALRPVIKPALAAVANEQPLHARLIEQVPAKTNGTVVSVTETGRPHYKDLAADGVDTVLEVTAPRLDVSLENAIVLTAQVRLVRVADREELYANTHTFKIASRSVSEWTADGGDALRAALVSGYQSLADEIVDELFRGPVAHSTDSVSGS